MQKKMSTFERYFRAEGEEKGTENTIRSFIERKRTYHVSDMQIHEDLLKFFGLDDATARRYMEPSLTKA